MSNDDDTTTIRRGRSDDCIANTCDAQCVLCRRVLLVELGLHKANYCEITYELYSRMDEMERRLCSLVKGEGREHGQSKPDDSLHPIDGTVSTVESFETNS